MKTFFIQTFGCQMNVYDGQRIASMLTSLGWTQTDLMPIADLIILNTCSIREKATNKVFSALGRIRKKKKADAIFGIVGCVAVEAGGDTFRRIPEINFVLGPQSYHKLPEILSNPDIKYLNIDLGHLEKFDALPEITKSGSVAYIPIMEGCNHCCTYCIVPFTRGRELSRPFDDIMHDTAHASGIGSGEICFLGQNVNGYKFTNRDEKQYNLSDLIKGAAKINSVKRIRFTSSYPTEMSDKIIEMFGTEPKLPPMLHLPIQSGSDDVLTRMNRKYDINLYIDIIQKLRKACPEIQISSDFIVGFPGETDDEFNKTLDVIRKIGFINSYSYKYSPRPHTAAAVMPDQVPDNVKRARLKTLDELLNEISRNFNQSCVGSDMLCLSEGDDKTGDNLIMRTKFLQQCIVAKKDTKIDPQNLYKIKITAANKSSLRGEFTD